MTYDITIIAPVVLLAVLAGVLGLFGPRRLRPWLAGACLLSSLLPGVWGVQTVAGVRGNGSAEPAGTHAGRPEVATDVRSWDLQVRRADHLWNVSEAARSYLPWTLIPVLLGAAGLLRASLGVRGKRRALLVAASGVAIAAILVPPALLARVWREPFRQGLWPVDDVRWTFGYVQASTRQPHGSPELEQQCQIFQGLNADPQSRSALQEKVPAAELERVRTACAHPQ